MSDLQVRRVQRVGTSSLVVTLPKSWARRLGIEQGTAVLLVDEGDSIRIVPTSKARRGAVTLDLSKVPPMIALGVPVCTFLSGYDRVEAILPPGVPVEELRMRALNFMGMHMYESGDRRIVIETLLDMEKIDPDALIKSLGSVSERLIRGLVGILRGAGPRGGAGRVEFARNDFMRTLYVVLRSLFLQAPREGAGRETVFKLMSASYVSLAIEVLYNCLPLIEEAGRIPSGDRENIARSLEELGGAINLLLHIIPNPSARRIAELIIIIRETMDRAMARIRESQSPVAGAVLSKIHDAGRVLMLSAYITVCRILSRLAENGGGATH